MKKRSWLALGIVCSMVLLGVALASGAEMKKRMR